MKNERETALLEAENNRLRQDVAALSAQVKQLGEQLLMMRQRQFGRSSEKIMAVMVEGQTSIFNEAEQECDANIPEPELEQITYKRKKQKGKRELDYSGLDVEQIVHELPEGERQCPDCGAALHVCGHDVLRRELSIIPAQYKVTEHVQTVYACRSCEKHATQTPMTKAKVPSPVVRGSGIASPSLVAHIANQKYCLALPLYRQEQELKRNQIQLSRQTMANWLIYTSEHWLAPIYAALKAELLSGKVAHADETVVQVLREDGKPAQSKSYMWLYRTSDDTDRQIVLYDYQPNRKYENPRIFLDGFQGYLHADGYEAYHHLPPGITVAGCWSHMRRKFTEIIKSLPDYNRAGSSAMCGKTYCDRLFALEREFQKLPPGDHFKARYEARQEKSKPVMDEFFQWVANLKDTPRTPMGKARAYALGEHIWLENVLRDGRLELSNNRAERSIRPFTVGRKNWLFSNTPKGATASAMFYSVIETAKENGLKPYEYLKYLFETAPNLPRTDDPVAIAPLLPWNTPAVRQGPVQVGLSDITPWDDD